MRTNEQREAVKLQMRRWRQNPENRAKELERNRQYLKKNRAKRNESVKRYRARKMQDPCYRKQQAANQRASYVRLREKLFAAYGNACVCCGEKESAFFEIDHVHGGGKKHLTSKPPVSVYREIYAAGCPAIYQLLCANCNRGRQRNGGTCPHQLIPQPGIG